MTEGMKVVILMLADRLKGTNKNAELVEMEMGIHPLSPEAQEYLESKVFQCPDCDYWFPVEEEIEGRCQDCYEEELEGDAAGWK